MENKGIILFMTEFDGNRNNGSDLMNCWHVDKQHYINDQQRMEIIKPHYENIYCIFVPAKQIFIRHQMYISTKQGWKMT